MAVQRQLVQIRKPRTCVSPIETSHYTPLWPSAWIGPLRRVCDASLVAQLPQSRPYTASAMRGLPWDCLFCKRMNLLGKR